MKKLTCQTLRLGNQRNYEADIMAEIKSSREKILIEVKGTGEPSFITFKKKDLQSNFFIWILFDRYYVDYKKDGEILIYIVKDLKKYITPEDLEKESEGRIKFKKFKEKYVKDNFHQTKKIVLSNFLDK